MSMLHFRSLPLIVTIISVLAGMSPALAQNAAAVAARYAALREPLAHNQFQRPLYLESSEASGHTQGDIYAVIEQPYSVVGPALQSMADWCDILILHQNVKRCRAPATATAARGILSVNVGRKFDQPVADAYLFEFAYAVAASGPGYLQVLMDAAQGPLGTSHYRIALEVVPIDAQRSFLHLSYAYANGAAAQLAARIYLATIGRGKVGFSIVGSKGDGRPAYIGGTRGVVERNSMRCYLAIEAYLGALSLPQAQRLEKRLSDWHAGVERFPLQLHELGRAEYLEMKRRETSRLPLHAGVEIRASP